MEFFRVVVGDEGRRVGWAGGEATDAGYFSTLVFQHKCRAQTHLVQRWVQQR